MTGQTDVASIADSGWPLLERLIEMAFTNLATNAPSALSVTNREDAAEQVSRFSLEGLPHPWVRRDVESPAELAGAATESLAKGPVLLLPPWGRLGPGSVSLPGLRTMAHEAILLDSRPAGPDSLLAALVPADMLTSERARAIREALTKQWQPVVLIYAMGVLPGVHPSLEVAAIFLRARQQASPTLRVFKAPRRSDASAVENDFRRLLARQGGRGRFGYVIRDPLSPGESLAFDRHDPDVLARRADLSGFGGTLPLGEMFELPPPAFSSVAEGRRLVCDSDADGAVRVITGRDIRSDGSLGSLDDQATWAQVPPDRQLRAGDIVLRQFLQSTKLGGLVAAEVAQEDLPAAANNHVIVLRPKVPLEPSQRLFTMQFLRAPLARTLAACSNTASLSRSALLELPVPQPDQALTAAIVDLAAAAEQFNAWRADAEALLQSVFRDNTAALARARIIRSGRLLRLKAEAASLLDDFGYTVRTRFPYPVSYRWRIVEASLSSGATTDAYEAILDAAEVLLCYSAHLALVMSHHANVNVRATADIRTKLASGRTGPGFGDWVAVLEEVSRSKAFRQLPDSQPLGELRSLLADSEADSARRRLATRRNDQAHLRRVDPVDLPRVLGETHTDLITLLKQAAFLCDLPLVHITSVRWDALQRRATVGYRELMGDHAVVPTQTMEHSENDLEEGSLYVLDAERRPHLLRPFLIGRDCDTCRNWSTFHVDRVPKDGNLLIKSLEHGHTLEEASLIEPLRHVGLL